MVDFIGLNNSYILLFLLAFFGGTSIFFPFPYYIFTISFGAAGLNPFLLGISAGFGTLLGDSTSYYVAYKGRDLVSNKFSKSTNKIFNWLMKRPLLFPIFTFFYAAIAPLPDDLIMIPAGFISIIPDESFPRKQTEIDSELG